MKNNMTNQDKILWALYLGCFLIGFTLQIIFA